MWPRGPCSLPVPPGWPSPASAETRCQFVLVAELSAPRQARRHLRAWLTRRVWPDGALDDIEYAVSEAVTNAVEHGYRSMPSVPGPATGPTTSPTDGPADSHGATVTVTVQVEAHGIGRRVRVGIRDHGRWRPPSTDPGFRGRGLQLMHALMHEVVILPDAAGTEVTLISTTVPGPPRLQR